MIQSGVRVDYPACRTRPGIRVNGIMNSITSSTAKKSPAPRARRGSTSTTASRVSTAERSDLFWKCLRCFRIIQIDSGDSARCAFGGYVTYKFTGSNAESDDKNTSSSTASLVNPLCEYCGKKRENHFGSYGECFPDNDWTWPYAVRCCECLLIEKQISKTKFEKKACLQCKVRKGEERPVL